MHPNTDKIYALIQQHEYNKAELLLARSYRSSDFELNRLGGFLAGLQGKHAEAYSYFQKAAVLKPQDPNICFNCANSAYQCGDLKEALTHVRHALTLDTLYATAWFLQGLIQYRLRDLPAALHSYRSAVSVKPDYLEALINLIQTLLESGALTEAEELLGQVLQLARQKQVATPEVWMEMAKISSMLKQEDIANYCFDIVITLDPDHEEALRLKGILLVNAGYHEGALPLLRRAHELDATNLITRTQLSSCLSRNKQFIEAIQCVEQQVLNGLFCNFLDDAYCLAKLSIMDWRHLDSVVNTAVRRVEQGELALTPFNLLMIKDAPDLQLQSARMMIDFSHVPVALPYTSKPIGLIKFQKIKVGYISPDFGAHPVSYLTAGLFSAHDKERFEVYAVSLKAHPEDNEYKRRIASTCDVFVHVETGSLNERIEQIRALNLDIAIDLCGHTKGSQIELFTNRIAPIQINYIGYPGTLGGAADYILADQFVIPSGMQDLYSEKVIRLPDCFQATDDQRTPPSKNVTRTEAGLPSQGFVFCCHNNTPKINQHMVDVWLEILEKTAEVQACLWLVADTSAKENLLTYIQKKNENLVSRVFFAPRANTEIYLSRMMCADLFLDTLPFNAGTTCNDALWMGLPVLTRTGESFAGRMATSLLNALDMPELVCESKEEYVEKAVRYALEPSALRDLKVKLDDKRRNGRLFDTKRVTRNLERAYEVAYEKYLKGEAPEGFDLT